MKLNSIKKYTVFTFVCFLSLIGITYAADAELKNGSSISITNATSCTVLPAVSGITTINTDTGVNIKFDSDDATTIAADNVTVSCNLKDGSSAMKTFKLNKNKTNVTTNNTYGTKIHAFFGAGTCSYSDPWKKIDGVNGISVDAGTSATLPTSCTPDKSKIQASDATLNPDTMTFAGWITSVPGETYQSVGSGSNACQGAQMNVTVSGSNSYGACYKDTEQKVMIQNGVPNSTLNIDSSWQPITATGTSSGYFHKGSGSVTLPSLTINGPEPDVEYEWVNQTTKQKVGPNASVPLNNDYWVAMPKDSGQSDNIYKSVYLNATTPVITTGIKGCTSTDSHVNVSFTGGECQVTGVTLTDAGQYADVLVNVGDNNQIIVYKFSVESRLGNTQGGDEDFVIDTSSAVIIGKNDDIAASGDLITNTCENFKISYMSESPAFSDSPSMTSALYNVEPDGCTLDAGMAYVALCLDPGRNGPRYNSGGATETVNYHKSSKIKADSDFGKLITYIANNVSADQFNDPNSSERVAAHVAARVVAINSGFSSALDKSDVKFKAHYDWYKAISDALKVGLSASDALDKSAWSSWGSSNVKSKVATILTEYKNVGDGSDGKLTREIDESKTNVSFSGNGYTLTYEGKFIIPANTEDGLTFTPACTAAGLSCSVEKWEKNAEETNMDTGKLVYNYTVKVTVNDALAKNAAGEFIFPPKTKEEQKNMSFKLTYKGNNTVDNIFLAEPADKFTYQRMLIFNVNENEAIVYVYFPVENVKLCEQIDALKSSNCPDKDHCTNFNKKLYKASGCCNFNAAGGSYVHDNVCDGECTKSTLTEICTFDPDQEGTTDTYYINEGKKKDGTDAIGECVVNVEDILNTDPTKGTVNVEKFQIDDDNGNSRNDIHYEHNQYCRVTCKEDWDLQMDNFGNFVGEKAVAAGTYFTDGSSVYLKSTRTCYTNYIDYDTYNGDEVDLSQNIIDNYNIYSLNSHVYTDIHRQQDLDPTKDIPKQTKVDPTSTSGCLQYKTCTQQYGSEYSSWNSDKKQCYKSKSCTAADTAAGKTDCNEYVGTLSCAYEATAYSYELETKGEVEESGTDAGGDAYGDVLYNGHKFDPKQHDVKHTTYNTQIEPKKDKDIENNYSSKAKITCTLTAASLDDGQGATGEYSCKMEVTHYELGTKNQKTTTFDNINPSCNAATNAYVTETTKDKNGNNITLNSKFKSGQIKVCTKDSTQTEAKYNKYVENAGTDDHGFKSPFQIMSDKMKELAKSNLTDARNKINAAHNLIYQKDRDMFNCQHFQLFNNEEDVECQVKVTAKWDDEKMIPDADKELSLGEDREYVLIDSTFDPKVSYTYEEDGFMTLLEDDNILVKYTQKNDEVVKDMKSSTINNPTTKLGDDDVGIDISTLNGRVNSNDVKTGRNPSDYANAVQTTYNDSCGIKIQYKDPNKNEYELPHDYLETEYYTANEDPWNEDEGKDYGGSGSLSVPVTTKTITFCTVYSKDTGTGGKSYWVGTKEGGGYTAFTSGLTTSPEWNGGHCYKVKLRYYQAHYIKQSISNGSFYKTKGSWYLRTSDVKEHGDDLDVALEEVGYNPTDEEYEYWSLLSTGYNVFPVSITTPRNLYQYVYYFGDIGSYSDGSLGRIMGNKSSIITLNKHLCFYEIYEELCLCCGDEIDTHYEDEDFQKTQQFISSTSGYNYNLSDIDKIKVNDRGQITFATSSVSLGDLNSDSGRTLGTNWSDKSPVYYNGHNLTTDKGAKLKEIIEHQGETVYEAKGESGTAADSKSMVEYRFTLAPETMQKIREYNRSHGYEIDYKQLKVYGKYSIANINDDGTINSSSSSLNFVSTDPDVLKNKVSSFQHLGSKFLEDTLGSMAGVVDDVSLSKRVDKDKNVCYVTSTDLSTAEQGANKIRELIKADGAECRWIDYVDLNPANQISEYNATDKKIQVITRLAFK